MNSDACGRRRLVELSPCRHEANRQIDYRHFRQPNRIRGAFADAMRTVSIDESGRCVA